MGERYTITKSYNNLKAAHAQWRHEGHCKRAHGENWTIHITFTTLELDDKNFIVDFGGLRGLRDQLEHYFDHTLLLDEDDPQKTLFDALSEAGRAKIHYLPSASAEGLSKFVFGLSNDYILNFTNGRVWVQEVTVEEDCKNTATYRVDEKKNPTSS